MPNEDKIKNRIMELCRFRCKGHGSFLEFAEQLLALGVIRHSYDVITNKLEFYSHSELLASLAVDDVTEQKNTQNTIAYETNLLAVKQAIVDYDNGIITSPIDFHHALGNAGIVYVSVHFEPRKIYYLSFDGQFYLEAY